MVSCSCAFEESPTLRRDQSGRGILLHGMEAVYNRLDPGRNLAAAVLNIPQRLNGIELGRVYGMEGRRGLGWHLAVAVSKNPPVLERDVADDVG